MSPGFCVVIRTAGGKLYRPYSRGIGRVQVDASINIAVFPIIDFPAVEDLPVAAAQSKGFVWVDTLPRVTTYLIA